MDGEERFYRFEFYDNDIAYEEVDAVAFRKLQPFIMRARLHLALEGNTA
jgi:hypothetical protein